MCSAKNSAVFFSSVNSHVTTLPMIPGKASPNFCANFPKRRARFFNCFLIHESFDSALPLLPPPALPPVKASTNVEINREKAAITAPIVKPCSLNIVRIFSANVVSESKTLAIVCRIRANCELKFSFILA